MSLFIDALIVAMVLGASYLGARRGLLLVALEIVSLGLSTVVASLSYYSAGRLLTWTGLTPPRARLLAFAVVWACLEIIFALLIRRFILRRFTEHFGRGPLFSTLAAAANGMKVVVIIGFVVIACNDLPLSLSTMQPLRTAVIPSFILDRSHSLVEAWHNGAGRDVTESLSVFVVTTDPESQQRIELGFKTTSGRVDESDERAMLVLINQERTQRGLAPLKLNVQAQIVARNYSRRMLAEGLFSHIDRDGHNPFDRLRAGGVLFGAAGENLALAPNLRRAHTGLMNSPGHRANILSENYRSVGIGIIDAGPYGLMVSQEFTD